MRDARHQRCSRNGISFVEISVGVVLLGVIAAFGIPRLLESAERSKASESFKYLACVQSAQERYQAQHDTYASDLLELDMEQTPPKFFTTGTISPGITGSLTDSWRLTLTRAGSSKAYGAYTVTFTDEGFESASSTINSEINPKICN